MTKISAPTLYAFLFAGLIAAGAAALGVGSGDLDDPRFGEVFLTIRGARLIAAFLAGAALASAGVLVQGLFRNPLASPSILGTTGGAMLGGKTALVAFELFATPAILSSVAPVALLPIGCLIGAFFSLLILLFFIRRSEDLLVLLLTGFILSSLFVSLGGFLTALAQESWELGRAVVAFSLGSVSGVGVPAVAFAAPLVLFGCLAGYSWGRPLDLLLSGSDEATSLGVDVKKVQYWSAVWVAVLTGAAVSLGGSLSFVGLIVPHALRPFAGVDHRRLLPASALAGGAFLVACDVVAKSLPGRSEVPLGVVTGLIGAPIFLYLLVRTYAGGRRVA